MNLNESMGKRIAHLRKEHHMTQEQLAESLDISVKHCSCVERGTASLSLERLLDVCDLFDVSLDYLVRGRSADNAAELPPFLLEMFQSEDDDEKKLLQDFLSLYRRLRQFYRE
ncbi:MAG: helix-turn-helix domain-containing protein [Clostridiales bacterium]|nr:helix-turn-helix domain-containing protein [Clostridiales bacterium]